MRTYARFATVPIGAGLAALDGGLTVTTTTNSADQSRTARSDIAQDSGVRGAEFVFWGAAALRAGIGVLQPAVALGNYVGASAQSVGWILNDGTIRVGGAVVANALPIPAKGETVGVRVDLDTDSITFYRGNAVVHTRALPQAGASWHFGVSMGSAVAGELACAVNAGQWIPASPAAAAGWAAADAAVIVLRLSDYDWLSAPTDAPANARYEGLIGPDGLETYAAMHHWAWAGDAPSQGGNAQVAVQDPDGVLDDLVGTDARGLRVAVSLASDSLAGATAVARFTLDAIEVVDDVRKVLHLRGAHDALDTPLSRGQFLPNTPTLAGRPFPAVIGAVASLPALPAVSDGSISFLCDAPLAALSAAYDRGDVLTPVTDWALDPSSQQLLLANAPLGPVVVDGSTIAADTGATLEQALRDLFGRSGTSAWTLADAQAIDAATGAAGIGYYDAAGGSCRDALARILPSFGAWWYADTDGALRIVRLVDPADTADAGLAFDLAAGDAVDDIVIGPDDAPNLTRRMGYRPNAYIHSAGDLVSDLEDVPPARRLELTSATRGEVYGRAPLPARYAHADSNPPLVSCFWNAADAQAELDRTLALYAVERNFYRWRQVDRALALSLKPGQVGRITYTRAGVAETRKVLVRDVQRNPVTGEVTATFWG